MLKNNLLDKIDRLEKERIEYLEADDNENAGKITKKLERAYLRLDILNIYELKQELAIYKNTVKKYPSLLSEVTMLLEQKYK